MINSHQAAPDWLVCLAAVGNFNLRDYGTVAAATGVSIPIGYAAGANLLSSVSTTPPHCAPLSIACACNTGAKVVTSYHASAAAAMTRPSIVSAAVLGAVAGFLLAYQNSSGDW